MTRLRSGEFACWVGSWRLGHCGPDEVVAAVTGSDAPHRLSPGDAEPVTGLVTGLDGETTTLHDVLRRWAEAGGSVRVVLPVAGDVRGVPGPAAFRTAGLDAGEAVHGAGIGLVPRITDHSPSSAPVSVLWQVFRVEAVPDDHLSVTDAQYELTEALRDAAVALHAADVAGTSVDDLADALHDVRRAGERMHLPPGLPSRAVALLAQAERLQAMLDLAGRDPLGGSIDRMGVAARDAALRPLATAVRRARLAGYNAFTGG